jgi:SecD/SecF fusion protein
VVDVADVRINWLSTIRDEARSHLRDVKIGFTGLVGGENLVQVRLTKPEDADAALKALADLARAVRAESSSD